MLTNSFWQAGALLATACPAHRLQGLNTVANFCAVHALTSRVHCLHTQLPTSSPWHKSQLADIQEICAVSAEKEKGKTSHFLQAQEMAKAILTRFQAASCLRPPTSTLRFADMICQNGMTSMAALMLQQMKVCKSYIRISPHKPIRKVQLFKKSQTNLLWHFNRSVVYFSYPLNQTHFSLLSKRLNLS